MARRKQCPRCYRRPKEYGDGKWCRTCTIKHQDWICQLVGWYLVGRDMLMPGEAVHDLERALRTELAIAPSDMAGIVSAARYVTGVYPTF